MEKEEESEVFAGSINGEGFLEIKITKPSSETILSKVVRLVRQAQAEKSPTETFVDRFSKYYTPAVVIAAILVALVPPLVFNANFFTWLSRALVLLVISCPCALTISTPVSMVFSITAARNGVLIKGGKYIESLSKVRMFVFDKTGTLTRGKLWISDVISFSPTDRDILALAASVESMSEHPIAKAILQKASEDKAELSAVKNFQSLRGKGVKGFIDGREVLVGKKELFQKIKENVLTTFHEVQQRGKTPVLVGSDGEVIGIVILEDRIKQDAAQTVSDLKKQSFEVVVISGDNSATTASIAKELGIYHYYAELLPGDKVQEVASLQKKYYAVTMIGDEVNDAPALARQVWE